MKGGKGRKVMSVGEKESVDVCGRIKIGRKVYMRELKGKEKKKKSENIVNKN